MAIAEVSIVPIGTSTSGLSNYVAGCIEELEKGEKVNYKLTSMGTILEGELDDILKIIRRMHERPFDKGVSRVLTNIRIDDRRDKDITMDSKVSSVQNKSE